MSRLKLLRRNTLENTGSNRRTSYLKTLSPEKLPSFGRFRSENSSLKGPDLGKLNKITPNIDIIFEEEPKSINVKKVSKSCSPKREPYSLDTQNKLSSLLSNFLASDPGSLEKDEEIVPNLNFMSPLDKIKSTNSILHDTQRPLIKVENS